jgi:hypothetical protein
LEAKNLDRQLFNESHIGRNKAEVMAKRLKCQHLPEWFSEALVTHNPTDWLFGCVDNNPARKAILAACDSYGCRAVICANETHSSEAYFYMPKWKGNPRLDPRVEYAPNINSDRSGNPLGAAAGCTGEAQANNRQLVTANFMAAALAAHLYVVWGMEARKVSADARAYMPVRLAQNLTRNTFVLRGEQ